MKTMKKSKRSRIGLATAGALALPLLVTRCGTASNDLPPETSVVREDLSLVRGAELFALHCYKCHPGGEAGVGPGIINKPLPRFLMKIQVRHGLGVMPEFPESKLSDSELDQLLDYLKALREAR